MTDEKYLFVTDCATKKRTGRSYYNRKTHAGKGGKVRLPHDNLTKKELEKMNGEVKSYRLNDPMSWKEFKSMPDDLKINYINLIRERYGVSDSCMAQNMFRIGQKAVSNEMQRLGISLGKWHGKKNGDKDGFLAWCGGVKAPVENEPEEVPVDVEEENACDVVECEPVKYFPTKAIPTSGDLTFTGAAEDVLFAVADILGGANVRINIMWEVCE